MKLEGTDVDRSVENSGKAGFTLIGSEGKGSDGISWDERVAAGIGGVSFFEECKCFGGAPINFEIREVDDGVGVGVREDCSGGVAREIGSDETRSVGGIANEIESDGSGVATDIRSKGSC